MSEISLSIPVSEEKIRKINAGEIVYVSGTIYTARDVAHKYLIEKANPDTLPFSLKDSCIYHCGPIVKKVDSGYEIVSSGPTTSIREEPYEAEVIEKYGVRAVIGKSGMGEKTLNAMKKFGAVYLAAIGGAAVYIAKSVKKVKNVYMLEEFGIPEAFWELEVENFPTICTMDSNGKSLHSEIEKRSMDNYAKLV